jgi:hypothetical protein
LFPLLDGESSLNDPGRIPLACLLKHWKDLDPESLQQKLLKFYCAQGWPQYPLGDEERWPEGGSINYNTILQLDMLCKKEGKWTEVPYVQLLLFLRNHLNGLANAG